MELSVIVPCFDEEACLPTLLDRLGDVLDADPFRSSGGAEAVIVDDGSRDATWSMLQRAAVDHAFVVAERHDRNRGLAAAWRTGLRRARGRLVCTMDADLQYRPEDIPRLHEALTSTGADMAQGVRHERHEPPSRQVLSRGLSAILNALFRMNLADNQSGFVLCPRDVFADLLSYKGRYLHWQNLISVAAHSKGYRICEVPTRFEERFAGQSFLADVPLRAVAAVLSDVVRAFAEYRLGV
jgi:phenylacetate-CoA ligase